MTVLDVDDLTVRYGDLEIVRGVSFSVEAGQWLMLIGPNGAGKSTVVSAIGRGVSYGGTIRYCGRSIAKFRPDELAREIGVLAQNHFVGYSFTVGEVVRLGRYAYRRGLFSDRDDDGEERIRRALEMTGLTELVEQSVLTLSGGELQRVFLAQLFAQNPSLLVLDEPTNHLDLAYQQTAFSLVGEWLKEPGRAVISVVHDLSLARRYGTHAVLMDHGRCAAKGTMEEVCAPEKLNAAYSLDVAAWMRGLLAQCRR